MHPSHRCGLYGRRPGRPAAAHHAAVERHFGRVAQLGRGAGVAARGGLDVVPRTPSSRLGSSLLQLAAHDARLLLPLSPQRAAPPGAAAVETVEPELAYLLQMAGHQPRIGTPAARPTRPSRSASGAPTPSSPCLDRPRARRPSCGRPRPRRTPPCYTLLHPTTVRAARGRPAPARLLSVDPRRAGRCPAAARSRRGRGLAGPALAAEQPAAPYQYGGAGAGARRRRGCHGRARTTARRCLRGPRRQAAVRARDAARAGRDRHHAGEGALVACGDDAGIAARRGAKGKLYDSQLRDAEAPRPSCASWTSTAFSI